MFVVFSDLVSENEKQNILNNIKLNLQKEFDALHIPKYIKELDEIPRNLLLKSKLSELRKLAEKEKNNFEKEKNSKFKRY